ncbi:phage tail protein [bacterium]|nr:phage tail protein [bacterium]
MFNSNSRYYGKVYIAERLGTSSQTPVTSSEVNNITLPTEWNATRKLSGIAYLYIVMEYDADIFPNGIPEIKAVIKGKKVYDPRTSSTAWSDNPALCIRDYLTSSYGLDEETANVDDTYVSTAANVCEYFNYPTLTGDPRFSLNGAFVTSITPADILNDLLTSMGGMIWYAQGKWRMKPAYYTSPVLDINEDDFRSAVNVSTRHSRRDNFNIVKGTWKGPDSFYQVTDYPQVPDAAAANPFVVADNGQESVVDLNLAFTDNVTQARRIARILLERNRQQLTIEASFGLRTFQLQVGDIVRVTNTRFGWTNKEFEVVKWTFGLQEGNDLQTQMTLREISESVFDDVDDGVVYETDNTTLLSPFDVPPVAVALNQEYRIINEHVTNVLVVNVTSTSATRVDYVEVEFKKSTDSTYSVLGTGDLGRFEILDIETPLANAAGTIVYDVRARAINAFGVKGEFTDAQKTVEADTTGPSAPSTFEKQLSGGTLFFSWTASTDFDLSYYKLWHSSSTTATFTDGSAQVIINKVARPATSVAYPALSGTFFIEPYDKSGNEGTVASVVVLPSELPALGTTEASEEDPDFNGVGLAGSSNVAVATGPTPDELRLSSFATAPSTGTYLFKDTSNNEYIFPSPSAIRTVRVSTNLTSTRHHANASGGLVNWDDIPNNWDTWPNNWDDWSDEDQPYGDFSTTVYVAATNDDPAGSPTWGSWIIAAGEVTGRAFKFKAELDSTNNNVSPSISVLEGIVEY